MEVAAGSWGALSLVFVSIIVRWAWSVLDWVWFKPKKLERCLREQGLKGNSYRFLYGDMKENSILLKEAKSKPMIPSTSHDIAPRLIPLVDQTVKTYGKNSFMISRKPVSNPLVKLLSAGLVSYEGEKWAKHRRIINPTFHVEKLKQMLPAFYKSCDEMIRNWESLASEEGLSCVLDVWPSLQNLTADVISRAAFGSSYQEGRKIFELLKEQGVYLVKCLQSVYIPGWRLLPTKMNKRMKEIDKEIKGLLKGIILKREKAIMAGEANKDDLLGALVQSNLKDVQEHGKNNKNLGMSIDDVIEECKLFYIAGQETTSMLLAWTMVLLGQNQNWQDRARQEVFQVFGSNKPDFDGLTHLKVVTMILLEVLRLFLEGVSKATKNRLLFFPFGAGPRICIGQNFAMTEAKLALSLILQHFTFELSPSYTHAPSALMNRPQYGVPILLQKR
ncbi:hypothetical protein M0R45_014473 [Rubus argutus]|uniref:Uncharacterized protein n=1 Tax=Rubus argutus TaxID=59490 RepID=A0AAW1XMR2_RUBAR